VDEKKRKKLSRSPYLYLAVGLRRNRKGLATVNACGVLLGRIPLLCHQNEAVQCQEHTVRRDYVRYVPYDVDVSGQGMARVVPPVVRSSKIFLVARIHVRPLSPNF
jgi:hypothetical protein